MICWILTVVNNEINKSVQYPSWNNMLCTPNGHANFVGHGLLKLKSEFFRCLRKHKKVSFSSLEFRNGRKSKVKSGLSLNSLWWESRPNKSTWTQDNSGALSWLKPSQQRWLKKKKPEDTHTQPTTKTIVSIVQAKMVFVEGFVIT